MQRDQAFRMGQDFLKGTAISGGPASLGLGGIVTLTKQPAQLNQSPGVNAPARNAKVTLGRAEDVLRTVEFRQVLDGLEVYGPTSILSLDVGRGGVVGGAINLRKIGTHGPAVSIISRPTRRGRFLSEFPYQVTTMGEGEDDDKEEHGDSRGRSGASNAAVAPAPLTGRLASTHLIYFEQGKGTLQPAYLFHVLIIGPGGTRTGLDWLVPAVQNTPEPILNHPVREGPNPIFADPSNVPAASRLRAAARHQVRTLHSPGGRCGLAGRRPGLRRQHQRRQPSGAPLLQPGAPSGQGRAVLLELPLAVGADGQPGDRLQSLVPGVRERRPH